MRLELSLFCKYEVILAVRRVLLTYVYRRNPPRCWNCCSTVLRPLCCSYPAVAMVNTNMVAKRGISSLHTINRNNQSFILLSIFPTQGESSIEALAALGNRKFDTKSKAGFVPSFYLCREGSAGYKRSVYIHEPLSHQDRYCIWLASEPFKNNHARVITGIRSFTQ